MTEIRADGALPVIWGRIGVNLVRHNRTLFIMDENIRLLPLQERIRAAVV